MVAFFPPHTWHIFIPSFHLQNEEVLKKCIQDYQSKLKVAEDKLQDFIHEAEVKIEE